MHSGGGYPGGGDGFGTSITAGFAHAFTGARSPRAPAISDSATQTARIVRSRLMGSPQFGFLLITSLAAFIATMFVASREAPRSLAVYFTASSITAAFVFFGIWPWDAEHYAFSESIRAAIVACVAVECGWALGLPKRLWRELLFRGCCGALSGGIIGSWLLWYLPRPENGMWGLRGMIGVQGAVIWLLGAVGRQEKLGRLKQDALTWLSIMAWADAIDLALVETGPFRIAGDWLGLIAWGGLCFFVTRRCFNAVSAPKTP